MNADKNGAVSGERQPLRTPVFAGYARRWKDYMYRCILCEQDLQEVPQKSDDFWFSVSPLRGIHYRCVDHLADILAGIREPSNTARTGQVAGDTVSGQLSQPEDLPANQADTTPPQPVR